MHKQPHHRSRTAHIHTVSRRASRFQSDIIRMTKPSYLPMKSPSHSYMLFIKRQNFSPSNHFRLVGVEHVCTEVAYYYCRNRVDVSKYFHGFEKLDFISIYYSRLLYVQKHMAAKESRGFWRRVSGGIGDAYFYL